jgi:hypothetical protein
MPAANLNISIVKWEALPIATDETAERPVVGVEAVARLGDAGRVNEPASTTSPACRPSPQGASFLRQPGHADGGMALHAGGQAGLFDRAVLAQDGAAPGQVDLARLDLAAAQHDAGVGGVVADGVLHLAHHLGVAVELLDAGVDDLDGGRDVVGGVQHVVDAPSPSSLRLQDEGQFDLDARRDEAVAGMAPGSKNMSSSSVP